jgi:hypothetical protein
MLVPRKLVVTFQALIKDEQPNAHKQIPKYQLDQMEEDDE